MKRFVSPLLVAAGLCLGVVSINAQVPPDAPPPAKAKKMTKGGKLHALSPHETTSAVIDGNRVMVIYGRPYTQNPKNGKDRTVWGGDLVPTGKIWRTGADEATILITQKPIVLGGQNLAAGAYSLYTWLDDADHAKLVINQQLGQWGLEYHQEKDVARVDLTKEDFAPAEHQFRIALEKNPAGSGGILKLIWESSAFTAPYTVAK